MARYGFVGLATAGLMMLAASIFWGGRPPLTVLMVLGFAAFFAVGVLFGNLNAMAMRSLGQVAGLGASLIASGSSLIATLFAIGLGAFYNGTTLNLSAGFFLAGISALVLAEIAVREMSGRWRPSDNDRGLRRLGRPWGKLGSNGVLADRKPAFAGPADDKRPRSPV